MPPNSFKRGPFPPPPRIQARTPSPPRDSYEPLNPEDVLDFDRSNQPPVDRYTNLTGRKLTSFGLQGTYNHLEVAQNDASVRRTDTKSGPSRSQVPVSPIDALANAASSAGASASPLLEVGPPTQSPTYTHAQHVFVPQQPRSVKRRTGDGEERPAKRARSEMLKSAVHASRASRPATSYVTPPVAYNVEQMVNNGMRMHREPRRLSEAEERERQQDAELLVFFTQTACFRKNSFDQNAHRSIVVTRPSEDVVHDSPPSEKDSSHDAIQTQTPPEDVYSTSILDETEKKVEVAVEVHNPERDAQKTELAKDVDDQDIPGRPLESPNAQHEDPIPDQLQSPKSLGHDNSYHGQQHDKQSADSHSSDDMKSIRHDRRKSEASAQLQIVTQIHGGPSLTRGISVPPDNAMLIREAMLDNTAIQVPTHETEPVTICPTCSFSSSMNGELKNWIECSGCQQWYHFACAGFRSDRDVQRVDKFFCRSCKPKYGPTTLLRKSKRAHPNVDYAGLNQGVIRTPDDTPEHHYIQHIKDGNFDFDSETFPRMRPELLTLDYFEKSGCFTEPIVIPAEWNPRPGVLGESRAIDDQESSTDPSTFQLDDYEYENYPDDGQDKLDMVMPQGLTVRRVAELYGPREPVEVIEVKSQEGSGRKWDMGRWADYYEDTSEEKIIRNVISLEVSQSKLGRLIRRPRVVREMDLQDAVWPQEEIDKGLVPKVQFYCLMSVADCYTDFHIDFGGSSVFYHIIKGKKTFFFIPPKPKHLKKYEEWCLSPAQNWTFLGGQTKECYRVDLSEGDTMLIPSGWIHAVWTPENSLVIGGNFLTRMHFDMQIKVAEIEKATKVARKFRYPHFQKVMWYSVLKYLEEDPLPQTVAQLFYDRNQFHRDVPIHLQTNNFGHNSVAGPENYNARYYSKQEINSLPSLVRFVHRNVMISLGKVENITMETRNAVSKSIPKGRGDPLEIIKTFAAWTAWKRGNEDLPEWAHPDTMLPEAGEFKTEKKLGISRKQPERKSGDSNRPAGFLSERQQVGLPPASSGTYIIPPNMSDLPKHLSTPKTSQLGPKRIACDACRKRRIRCKHKDDVVNGGDGSPSSSRIVEPVQAFATPVAAIVATSPESVKSRPHGLGTPFTGSNLMRSAQQALSMSGSSSLVGLPSESVDGKKGRNKACVECRRSKRRCIHDENGAIDPVKAQEAKIPRGTTSHKKRRYMEIVERSQREKQEAGFTSTSVGESSPEDVKMVNGIDTAYSSQTPNGIVYGQSMGESQYDQSMDYEDEEHNEFDRNYEDFVVSSIEDHNGAGQPEAHTQDSVVDSAIDPSLAATAFNPPRTPKQEHEAPPISSPLSDLVNSSPRCHVNGLTQTANHPYYSLQTPQPASSAMAQSPPNGSSVSSMKRKSGSASKKDVKPFIQHRSPIQHERETPKTEAELSEEQSLKLARELQESEWGLRRRRGSKPSV
ncbi:hypothetical protein EJ05DRAFT_498076 [Pseudovirgaria hyperparasitica]|uniref:JmjC domain-containing histone demethylation protein 1 n=1 Tax=Pseudovirgaria hyperparasitica TaxID=470096 RepID=A0A6A6WDH0_9PEZI|nr:uncharacterized protein EJ05DRAFT_498076 [Pseudovirgaria hyperparasitica]KAF2760104.1 hypothetical protein EJ05DRAFT_498076 [Pseudovirgaria hyperparasitica]